MIKPTSWSAYQDILRGGVAKTQAERVLQTLNYQSGMTRSELAQATNYGINSVCGRVKELLDSDVIYVSGTRNCRVSGKLVEELKVVEYN
ncbi:HTH domain-containing protein [Aeromonas phage Aer_P220]|uniref:HTH domain-containing protein n=1 Tax=Aeromonas phage Aer_P220 TaxID=2951227 RepID=A0A9E7NLP3_9CAUD|nr:HTH domain-containing protein [Aeromonas phage Aer_P220]